MCATVQELDDYLRSHVPPLCSRYHRPVQNPVCRAEPLSVRSSFVASPEKRHEWGKAVLLGRDITPLVPGLGNATGALAGESDALRLCAIDFGTSYSSVARLDEASGSVQLIPGPEGKVLIPSVVAFMKGRGYMTGAGRRVRTDAPGGRHLPRQARPGNGDALPHLRVGVHS